MEKAIGKESKRAFLDKLRFRRFGSPAIESGIWPINLLKTSDRGVPLTCQFD